MLRRTLFAGLWCCVCIAMGITGLRSASAIEVDCIEASKYKYLYLIFDNDRRKFARFFRVEESRLPDGETCRAVTVTGRIDSASQSKEAGQVLDADKILRAVSAGKGWLATVYLASRGGNIGTGLAMAQMVRMFWLKAEAPNAQTFVYWPDFIPRPAIQVSQSLADAEVPPELAQGWRVYVKATASLALVTLPPREGRCASACTFAHVSGIDRHGTIFVHRGRAGASKTGEEPSMAQILEGLHRAENRVISLYRNMDGGEDMVRLFQATPTATVRPAVPARYPRYISDLLRGRCKADSVELLGRETKLRAAVANAASDQVDRLKSELTALQARRATVEHCGAAAHERERLTQFRKFCLEACNRSQIVATVNARLRELGPVQAPAPLPKPGSSPQSKARP